MNKQELRQWIIEFAKAPAYPEVIDAIDIRIEFVIAQAIAEHEQSKWKKYPEEKPTDYEYYWVHHADGTEDKCICYHLDLFVESRKIIAFRELPAPFKGKEERK